MKAKPFVDYFQVYCPKHEVDIIEQAALERGMHLSLFVRYYLLGVATHQDLNAMEAAVNASVIKFEPLLVEANIQRMKKTITHQS